MDEDSWYSQLRAEGYQVDCVLKGLGEYAGIRNLFIRHVMEAGGETKDLISHSFFSESCDDAAGVSAQGLTCPAV